MVEHIGLSERMITEVSLNGIASLFKKAWRKAWRFLFYTTCSVWYRRELDKTVSGVIPELEVQVGFLTDDKRELIEWLRSNHNIYPWIFFEKEIESALENDHVFVVLKEQGNIIGYIKVGCGPAYIGDIDKTVVFEPKTAFIYDTFILPGYRGKNLSVFAINQVARYLKDKEFERILCHIERWNTASIKAFRKAGFHAGASIRLVRIARFSFFVRNGFVPFLSLEKHLRAHGLSKWN